LNAIKEKINIATNLEERVFFWFIVTLVIIVNLGWYTGGGFNIANTSIFYRSSHDFRRPLTSLMGLSKVAMLSLKETEGIELFQQVNATAHQMDKMLLKFLMLYQINHYDELEPVELNKVTELAETRIFSKDMNIDFSFDIKAANYGDNDPRNRLLEIILFNLIENSVMFANSVKPKIDCRIWENKKNMHVAVEDNGIGIPEKYEDQIFELYFRGSLNSTGNGLGLYVAKKAIEKLNGKALLESAVNEFTRFEITFPIN